MTFDHCQYADSKGPFWKKSTKLLVMNAASFQLDRVMSTCRGRRCSRNNARHTQLSGVDTKNKKRGFLTAKASAYPVRFCVAFAKQMAMRVKAETRTA